jgi:hypothetical protein
MTAPAAPRQGGRDGSPGDRPARKVGATFLTGENLFKQPAMMVRTQHPELLDLTLIIGVCRDLFCREDAAALKPIFSWFHVPPSSIGRKSGHGALSILHGNQDTGLELNRLPKVDDI